MHLMLPICGFDLLSSATWSSRDPWTPHQQHLLFTTQLRITTEDGQRWEYMCVYVFFCWFFLRAVRYIISGTALHYEPRSYSSLLQQCNGSYSSSWSLPRGLETREELYYIRTHGSSRSRLWRTRSFYSLPRPRARRYTREYCYRRPYSMFLPRTGSSMRNSHWFSGWLRLLIFYSYIRHTDNAGTGKRLLSHKASVASSTSRCFFKSANR